MLQGVLIVFTDDILTLLDSEDDFRTMRLSKRQSANNSSSQNYSHPDDHTIRTTDTPEFKPFTMTYLFLSSLARDLIDFFEKAITLCVVKVMFLASSVWSFELDV